MVVVVVVEVSRGDGGVGRQGKGRKAQFAPSCLSADDCIHVSAPPSTLPPFHTPSLSLLCNRILPVFTNRAPGATLFCTLPCHQQASSPSAAHDPCPELVHPCPLAFAALTRGARPSSLTATLPTHTPWHLFLVYPSGYHGVLLLLLLLLRNLAGD